MFGANEIVGQRFFRQEAQDRLLVTSLFYTMQGEGPFRGEPAFFIRLSHCNLACSFCDTYFSSGDWFSMTELNEEIDRRIKAHFADKVPNWASADVELGESPYLGMTLSHKREMVLVITGGEPMLQANIGSFLRRMRKQFAKTQIESNGLLLQEIPDDTILVVSPKCSEKNGRAIKYLKPLDKVLKRADCLKFVMEAPKVLDQKISTDEEGRFKIELEYTPYSTVPEWAHEWRDQTGKDVYVSPMNIYLTEPQKVKELRANKAEITLEERSTIEERISWWTEGLLNLEANRRNHEYSALYAAKHGFTFGMQLHLFANLP